ncbi:hypothetical protein Barb7_00322 [Bacteroidales bacterium Barb7]|nr:hypothetical protein Barb7_00322 [Bacteroidales bacterium Barb7]
MLDLNKERGSEERPCGLNARTLFYFDTVVPVFTPVYVSNIANILTSPP